MNKNLDKNQGLIQETIQHIFQNYFKFSGRTPRRYFWMFHFLSYLLIGLNLALWLLVGYLGLEEIAEVMLLVTSLIIFIGLLPINLGVFIRRLHDLDNPGWLILIAIIPIINILFVLLVAFSPSFPESNKYGTVM